MNQTDIDALRKLMADVQTGLASASEWAETLPSLMLKISSDQNQLSEREKALSDQNAHTLALQKSLDEREQALRTEQQRLPMQQDRLKTLELTLSEAKADLQHDQEALNAQKLEVESGLKQIVAIEAREKALTERETMDRTRKAALDLREKTIERETERLQKLSTQYS